MLAKDNATRDTLRMLISEIKRYEIDNRVDADDSVVLATLKKMIKQRNESCEVYKKAGSTELLESENREIEVINKFLPNQLSEEETKKICEETIKSVNATSMKDMGKIMGVLKSKHADSLDFSKVSSILKGLLN